VTDTLPDEVMLALPTQPSLGAPPELMQVDPAVAFQVIVNESPGTGVVVDADRLMVIGVVAASGTVIVAPPVTISSAAI
jgi:hypothetical protein